MKTIPCNYGIFNRTNKFHFSIPLEMDSSDKPVYAEVTDVFARGGARGSVTQVRVKITSDNRTLIRNVRGAVQVGDTLCLLESERDAKKLR